MPGGGYTIRIGRLTTWGQRAGIMEASTNEASTGEGNTGVPMYATKV